MSGLLKKAHPDVVKPSFSDFDERFTIDVAIVASGVQASSQLCQMEFHFPFGIVTGIEPR